MACWIVVYPIAVNPENVRYCYGNDNKKTCAINKENRLKKKEKKHYLFLINEYHVLTFFLDQVLLSCTGEKIIRKTIEYYENYALPVIIIIYVWVDWRESSSRVRPDCHIQCSDKIFHRRKDLFKLQTFINTYLSEDGLVWFLCLMAYQSWWDIQCQSHPYRRIVLVV